MPKVGFFPGSTIGNFEPHEAQAFLKSARAILGRGAQMIIGADLEKEERLLHDALRTNDPRLVAAALGTYAARLDPAAWRQAVLKCLFVGVPLRLVAGLDRPDRSDDELRRMVAEYAAERRAAGREVPADALPFLPVPTQTTRES